MTFSLPKSRGGPREIERKAVRIAIAGFGGALQRMTASSAFAQEIQREREYCEAKTANSLGPPFVGNRSRPWGEKTALKLKT